MSLKKIEENFFQPKRLFSPNNEFDTCIFLRTALIKDNKFYVQAGQRNCFR